MEWAPAPNVLLSSEDDLTVGGELQTQFFHNGGGDLQQWRKRCAVYR